MWWRPSRISTSSLDNNRSCPWYRRRIFGCHSTTRLKCTQRRSRKAGRNHWLRTSREFGRHTCHLAWYMSSPQSSWQSKHPRWKVPYVCGEVAAIHRPWQWWNLPSCRTVSRDRWEVTWRRKDTTKVPHQAAVAQLKDKPRTQDQDLTKH